MHVQHRITALRVRRVRRRQPHVHVARRDEARREVLPAFHRAADRNGRRLLRIRPAQEHRQHPRPTRLVVPAAFEQIQGRVVAIRLARVVQVRGVAELAQPLARLAIRRFPAFDQVAGVVEHVDDAVVVAVVGSLLAADAEEQLRSRHRRTAIDQRMHDPRGLHRIRIRVLRRQPERRRERTDPAEQFRILPADPERAECAQRPAEDGAAIGAGDAAVARIDGRHQRLRQPLRIRLSIRADRAVLGRCGDGFALHAVEQAIAGHAIRRHVDGDHDDGTDRAARIQAVQRGLHADRLHVLPVVDVQHVVTRLRRLVIRRQVHAHTNRLVSQPGHGQIQRVHVHALRLRLRNRGHEQQTDRNQQSHRHHPSIGTRRTAAPPPPASHSVNVSPRFTSRASRTKRKRAAPCQSAPSPSRWISAR